MDENLLSPELDALLAELWAAGGSDLLLTAGTAPLLRVNGRLHRAVGRDPLDGSDTERITGSILSERQLALHAAGDEVDFSFAWRGTARVRGNAFRQRGAVALALRIIPRAIPGFDELRLPPVVRELGTLTQGLVFVTGPTGSGKSTTLASLVDWINTHRALHILTIEDPIEYMHDHKLSAVSQREVGTDTATFPQALRNALREDPDVILVGEMRDLESIRFALTLAETGHLVLATLHTNDTAQSVDRLVDVFPSEQQPQIRVQLAHTLSAIVHQRLLPRIGGGMVAAHEVLVATAPVRNLIKEGKSNQLRNQVVTGQGLGMQTVELSLNDLVREGLVSYDEAVTRSGFPDEIERLVPAGASAGHRR